MEHGSFRDELPIIHGELCAIHTGPMNPAKGREIQRHVKSSNCVD
jgi:hypothetical protein